MLVKSLPQVKDVGMYQMQQKFTSFYRLETGNFKRISPRSGGFSTHYPVTVDILVLHDF